MLEGALYGKFQKLILLFFPKEILFLLVHSTCIVAWGFSFSASFIKAFLHSAVHTTLVVGTQPPT
jgi:Na+/H+ antiporter NhaB